MKKKHKKYEEITTEIYKLISPKSNVKHDQRIKGKSGVLRQVDILIEDCIASHPIRIAVDCKYYSSKVDINDVAVVWDIVDDVHANLGVIVSNAGFTKGALRRANELGRLKLCSIFDMKNKDFSVNIALPVVCEFRRPIYEVIIESAAGGFELSSIIPTQMFIENYRGETTSIRDALVKLWNNNTISHEIGKHTVDFSSEEWKIVGPSEKFTFSKLQVEYEVRARFHFGYVPLVKGKGLVDIQEKCLKTPGFRTDKIDMVEVEKNWDLYEKLEDIKIQPFLHIVASDLFNIQESN